MGMTVKGNVGAKASSAMRQAAPTLTAEQSRTTPSAPGEAVEVIEPGRSWVTLDPRTLWAYRELFYFLVWRDLKVRYKQAVLGIAWVALQPLMITLIFTIFLGVLARVPSDDIPYPLFAYGGLVPWMFFTGAITSSSNSLVGSSNLITKIYFPRIIIPSAAIGARLIDFGIAFVILAGLMIYYRFPMTLHLAVLPLLIALLALFSLGVGMWTSALNVKYRDVGVVLPVAIQLWMFISPIAYPSSLVPERWRWLYALNPLAGIIENFRACVFGRAFDWGALAASTAVTLGLLVYSAYTFRRMEKSFADII
jgi:lipopolysaccharide transport system permease protein